MPTYFTTDDAWTGGFYELAIEAPSHSDDVLYALFSALWSHPTIQGCYLDRAKEPFEQTQLPITHHLLTYTHVQGIARIPGEVQVACGTCLLRSTEGSPWLVFYIPTGSLETIYPLHGFPFFQDHTLALRQWQEPLDAWLATLGQDIYATHPFQLGLIGHEVAGETNYQELMQCGVPVHRRIGYLCTNNDKLTYHAKNRFP